MPVRTTYPGVYIEERPSGVRTIMGVSTSVTAFVGSAAKGPADTPIRIFSFPEYVRNFGLPLDAERPMGHAVAQYFANGGSEAIIVRVLATDSDTASLELLDTEGTPKKTLVLRALGKGSWANRQGGVGVDVAVGRTNTVNPEDLFSLTLRYRTPDPRSGAPTLTAEETFQNLSMSPKHSRYVLNVVGGGSELVQPALPPSPPTTTAKGSSESKTALPASVTLGPTNNTVRLSIDYGPPIDLVLFPAATSDGTVSKTGAEIKDELNAALDRFAVGPAAALPGPAAEAKLASGTLTLESRFGGPNSAVVVSPAPSGDLSKDLKLGLAWGGKEVSGTSTLRPAALTDTGLAGGKEGSAVSPVDTVPPSGSGGVYALQQLRFPRFNLLCLPGITSDDDVQVQNALAFCKAERGFLIVDSPVDGWQGAGDTFPPNLGSLAPLGEHGAVYFPRLRLVEPLPGGTSRTLNLPACGAVAGVMARTDTARGIWKAPAGIDAGIVGASGLSAHTDDPVSGLLNPLGINVLRDLPGVGTVVWGARTLRGDDTAGSEYKYVPIRRLTDYVASSLYLGTRFAVFEPNDPDLWGQIRLAVGTFMRGLFRQGAFQQSPARDEGSSFFVTCDETVNPQSEIDQGRVNVVVGFAPLKPAEFVVIAITQISHLEE